MAMTNTAAAMLAVAMVASSGLIAWSFGNSATGTARSEEGASLLAIITPCDILAAHPDDPERVTDGIADDKIVPRLAVPACEQALANSAKDPRLIFQLGRAFLAAGKKSAAYEQFNAATEANYAAGWAYLGDSYQFGHGVEADDAKAFEAYKKALDAGFLSAKSQLEQLAFDKTLFASPLVNATFMGELGTLTTQVDTEVTKWLARSYIFSLTQKLIAECGRIIKPQQIEKVYRLRYGRLHSADVEANTEAGINSSVGDYDAETFLRRHGCESPVSKRVFFILDQFLAARSGD